MLSMLRGICALFCQTILSAVPFGQSSLGSWRKVLNFGHPAHHPNYLCITSVVSVLFASHLDPNGSLPADIHRILPALCLPISAPGTESQLTWVGRLGGGGGGGGTHIFYFLKRYIRSWTVLTGRAQSFYDKDNHMLGLRPTPNSNII